MAGADKAASSSFLARVLSRGRSRSPSGGQSGDRAQLRAIRTKGYIGLRGLMGRNLLGDLLTELEFFLQYTSFLVVSCVKGLACQRRPRCESRYVDQVPKEEFKETPHLSRRAVI